MKARPNISWHKVTGRWCAYGNLMGVRKHLGLFETEAAADAAAAEFKRANDIESGDAAPFLSRVVYRDGNLYWRQHGRGHEKDVLVGSVDAKRGYRFVRVSGKKAYVHRLVWELFNDPIPAHMEIDHINGVRDDNRAENLRLVTRAENLKNLRLRASNKTGCAGVCALPDGNFVARISNTYIGRFGSAHDAIAARKSAEAAAGYHPNHGRKAS